MDTVAAFLIVIGAALSAVAAVGLQRFDDVLARMHSATKPATLGLILVVAGAGLVVVEPGAIFKLVLVLLLQMVTAPLGAHLIGRAAIRAGEASPATYFDDEARALQPE